MFAWDMVGRSNFLQLLHRPVDAGLNVDSVPKLPCSYTAKDHMSWRLFPCIADIAQGVVHDPLLDQIGLALDSPLRQPPCEEIHSWRRPVIPHKFRPRVQAGSSCFQCLVKHRGVKVPIPF